MVRKALVLGLTLAAGVAAGVIGAQLLNAQQEASKRTLLLKADLVGMAGKEAQVLLVELAPGAAAGKHYHPGHELGYVLEGSFTFEVEGKPPVTLEQGGTLYVPPRQVHNPKNASKTAPAKALVFAIAEKGQPAAVPVK